MIEASIPIQLVVTDRECTAETIATRNNIALVRVERNSYGKDFDRDTYTCEVRDALINHEIDLIAMAGFGTILNKPIYECTAAYGHFGRKPGSNGSFSWEKTDKSSIFKK